MKEILFTACSCSITCRRNKNQHQAPSKFWRSGYWKQLSDLIMIVSYTSLFINYLNSLQRDVHPDSLLVFALGTSSYSHALQKYSDCKTTEVLHILTLTEGGYFLNKLNTKSKEGKYFVSHFGSVPSVSSWSPGSFCPLWLQAHHQCQSVWPCILHHHLETWLAGTHLSSLELRTANGKTLITWGENI